MGPALYTKRGGHNCSLVFGELLVPLATSNVTPCTIRNARSETPEFFFTIELNFQFV
jgi:hypothetical protein